MGSLNMGLMASSSSSSSAELSDSELSSLPEFGDSFLELSSSIFCNGKLFNLSLMDSCVATLYKRGAVHR